MPIPDKLKESGIIIRSKSIKLAETKNTEKIRASNKNHFQPITANKATKRKDIIISTKAYLKEKALEQFAQAPRKKNQEKIGIFK